MTGKADPSAVSRVRVMLVGPFPPTKGGVTTFMLNLMASSLRHEVNFIPFTTTRPPKKNVIDNWGYAAMLRGGLRRILQGIAITLWHLAIFPSRLIRQRIDIVQIQACDYQVFWESALYALIARAFRRAVLFRIGGAFDVFHGNASPFERRLIGAVLKWPDALIAQSAYARDYLVSAGRTGPIILLPNWSRTENISEKLDPASEMPTCLFIAGGEARRKGIEEVLVAAAELQRRGSPVRFHLIAVPESLAERVAKMNLTNIVAIEGPLARDQVQILMQRYDIFLLPSHGEGFPNSLVEAMGAGMAAIATPVGAVPEMLADGAGIIVPLGDGLVLAAAIARIAGNPILCRDLSARAIQTVRQRYTENAALPELAAAFKAFSKKKP